MLKKGFTLAEVLLTLAIIGVVAAIILPAVMTNVNDSVLEAQAKKFYSQLTDGLELYKAQNEQDSFIPGFNIDNFVNQIMSTSGCKGADCFANVYTSMSGETLGNVNTDEDVSRRLRDGSAFNIAQVGEQNRWEVFADVNGKKGPNRAGEDLWHMYINAQGRVEIATDDNSKAACKSGDAAGDCIGLFVANNFRLRRYKDKINEDSGNGGDGGNDDGGDGGNNNAIKPPVKPFKPFNVLGG